MSYSIPVFLKCSRFAVVGASTNRNKFGNKVLRHYVAKGKEAIPVHPKETEVEGIKVQQLADIANTVQDTSSVGISVITPPKITKLVIEEAAELGFKNIWLQPGAESEEAIKAGEERGLNLIHSGPCVLVELC